MFRQAMMAVADHPWVSNLIQRHGMRWGVQRFVAGESLDEALGVVQRLNGEGIAVTLDHLGEEISTAQQTQAARDSYLTILEAMHHRNLDANVSLKLTMMGLAIDPELAYDNTRRIVANAHATGNFVWIDMEGSRYTTKTLDLYRRLAEEFPGRVGIVLQAYLYRTPQDLAALSGRPEPIRIVKGAYLEPPHLAFPAKADVDESYFHLVTALLQADHYTAIATHDEALIQRILEWIEQNRMGRDRFEFQLLFGIKPSLARELARRGYKIRVYVPFGREWYAYFTRRLAERPANLIFFVRSLWRR